MLRAAPVVLIFAVLLSACATVPSPPVPAQAAAPLPRFDAAQPPARGMARLYVFRPRLADQAPQYDRPLLRIGQTELTALPEGGYVDLQLPAGRHTLSVAPPPGGSDLWRTSLTMQLARDSVGFLALWMDEGYERSAGSTLANETVLLVLPIGTPAETAAHLRVERMPVAEAVPVLRECCVRVFP